LTETNPITRRAFLKMVGIAVAISAVISGAMSFGIPYLSKRILAIKSYIRIEPTKGVILVDDNLCAQCRTCEAVCTTFKDGKASNVLTRIQVEVDWLDGQSSTISPCLQCVEPQCMRNCPFDVYKLDPKTNARVVDENLCHGCHTCVDSCPFVPGRVRFDEQNRIAKKCDLCGGDPQCVAHCPQGALTYYFNSAGIRTGYPIAGPWTPSVQPKEVGA